MVVIGGGNTAMDCCRSALRLGGKDVRVTVRSPRADMKASDWEIEDAEREGVPIFDNHQPKEFVVENGKLKGVMFARVEAEYSADGKRTLVPTGEEVVFECDDVLMAIGQDNAFPWIERDIGIDFNEWEMPTVDNTTMMSTRPGVFFGGDAAWGPENIIWAVAHGHQAAISIDLYCHGKDLSSDRPPPGASLASQKMGIHEWAYDNDYSEDARFDVPHEDHKITLKNLKAEVELGFDDELAYLEAERCLNCDVQTVFVRNLCIECDACVDICPVDCINFTANGEEDDLRARLRVPAKNQSQDIYVSDVLKTGRIMAKDEDLCLHCGLCAERCPTGAWDMQKFTYVERQANAGRPAQLHGVYQMKRSFDFVVKFANVNGSGSASANLLFAKSMFRMGLGVVAKNIFPSNIQGLPTWYEVRVTQAGRKARRDGVDIMVAMNAQTYTQDVAEINPRRFPDL